jgi:hypothetical protein
MGKQYCEVLTNLIYRFNIIPTNISASCFVDIGKLILMVIQRRNNKLDIESEESWRIYARRLITNIQ